MSGYPTPTGLARRPLIRCRCRCHCCIGSDNDTWTYGVDVRDPLEAAAACPGCIDQHSPALLGTALANDASARDDRNDRSAPRSPEPSSPLSYEPPQADGWRPPSTSTDQTDEDGN